MKMINYFNLKVRRLKLRITEVDVASAYIQRSRGVADTAPPAILSYSDVILMKPAPIGRHNMGNKELGRFKEEAKQWFVATRMGAISETNQTRLMGVILVDTLYLRSTMKLWEREPMRNFFGAMAIITVADTQRDPQIYPHLLHLVAHSGSLN